MEETAQKVYVTHGRGPHKNVKEALSKIDAAFFRGRSVLIKPNVGRKTEPGRGINTHPEAVAGVIEALREAGAGEIVIGESPIVGVNTLEAFETSGIAAVARKYSIPLIDLNDAPPITREIPDGVMISETKLCSPIYRFDIILSLPVAKSHMHTGVTLGLKNMKGCLYKREKVRYHQLERKANLPYEDKTLDIAISDLATILLPDITVIDGYIGMEGLGPSGGEPVYADFAVASTSPVGADVIGCIMMERDPLEVPHIRLIAERLGFPAAPDGYSVFPANYREFSTHFKEPSSDISLEYPDVVLYDIDSCSACLSTVMFFLKRFKEDMRQYLPEGEKLHLAIGKGIKDIEIDKNTILVGNCAKCPSNEHIFVKGCPPVPTRIYQAITGKEPSENEPDID